MKMVLLSVMFILASTSAFARDNSRDGSLGNKMRTMQVELVGFNQYGEEAPLILKKVEIYDNDFHKKIESFLADGTPFKISNGDLQMVVYTQAATLHIDNPATYTKLEVIKDGQIVFQTTTSLDEPGFRWPPAQIWTFGSIGNLGQP